MASTFTLPLFIAFEGIDGSGQTTQTEDLAKYLDGIRVKFPNYGSDTGDWLARMIKSGEPVDPMVFQCVQTVDKYAAQPGIRSLLARGQSVVLDRYFASAIAYGMSDGLDESWLWDIHSAMLKPDLYFLLDLDADTSFARRPARLARYESNAVQLDQIATEYRKLFSAQPGIVSWRGKPTYWVIVDGRQSQEAVTKQILETVEYVTQAILTGAAR